MASKAEVVKEEDVHGAEDPEGDDSDSDE